MKKLNYLLIMLLGIIFLSSCRKVTGDGPVETEERVPNSFSGLLLEIPGTVYFTKSNNFKVQLKAQRSILNVIKTSVKGNQLVLTYKSNTIVGRHTGIELHVSTPLMESIHMDCSGTIRVYGNIVAQNLQSEVSSSGSLIIDSVQISTMLTATVSGSGKINLLSGQTSYENIHIDGSGNVDAGAIKAKTSTVKIDASGYTKVFPTETLSAFIDGSGSVYYFGNPHVSSHISGSGKVVKL